MVFPALKRDQFNNVVQESYVERAFRGEYDGSDNLIYAGFAQAGSLEGDAVWQIMKLAYTADNLTSITWPQIDSKASTGYTFSWTDRASYTYS